jgi:ABC-type nitrate/sulfonate/bicarbonate transport system permease component
MHCRSSGRIRWMARQAMRAGEMYAVRFIIAVLGVLNNHIPELATHRLAPWQNREHHYG